MSNAAPATLISRHLSNERETLAFAGRLFRQIAPGGILFLYGDLGAGKTTFVRGALRAAGFEGAVKSPTFTLVEEYTLPDRSLYHFDLYRLGDPEELEWLGIRDYLRADANCLIEWPERGAGFLPGADLEIRLALAADEGRDITVKALTERGRLWIESL